MASAGWYTPCTPALRQAARRRHRQRRRRQRRRRPPVDGPEVKTAGAAFACGFRVVHICNGRNEFFVRRWGTASPPYATTPLAPIGWTSRRSNPELEVDLRYSLVSKTTMVGIVEKERKNEAKEVKTKEEETKTREGRCRCEHILLAGRLRRGAFLCESRQAPWTEQEHLSLLVAQPRRAPSP